MRRKWESGGVKQMGGREMCWRGIGGAKGLNPGTNTSIRPNPQACFVFVANMSFECEQMFSPRSFPV